eukprot:GILI01017009.1.p1 GENE.GILI01017009.1~~GILI01017009.1.p1  ORF type:complete len:267 (-),score=92.51 GILI01017009.1:107-907(-)
MRALILFAVMACVAAAQDPAQGWLSYATASCPAGTRLTKFTGTWQVPQSPEPSDAFYSPWIGTDPADNLNLLQPVNPWFGNEWAIYTEYFQWSPENNLDSNQQGANSGDQLVGSIVFNGEAQQSYTVSQVDTAAGGSSSQMSVPVQTDNNGNYKNYSIAYVVFEKTAYCGDYPPEEQITFGNLTMECNGKRITPQWTTSFVEDCCDFRAHVVDSQTITMTWSTSAPSLPAEKIEAQYAENRKHFAARKAAKSAAIHAHQLPPQRKN